MWLSLIWRASRVRTWPAMRRDRAHAAAAGFLDALQDGRQVPQARRARRAAPAAPVAPPPTEICDRDQVGDELLLLARQILEQLHRLGVGEQLGHRVADDSVRWVVSTLAGSTTVQIAEQRRRRAGSSSIQSAGRPNAGSDGPLAGQVRQAAATGPSPAAWSAAARRAPASISLTRIDVGVGGELQVVLDPHRRQHEAHLGRDGAAQALDLLGQPRRVAAGQRKQAVAEFQAGSRRSGAQSVIGGSTGAAATGGSAIVLRGRGACGAARRRRRRAPARPRNGSVGRPGINARSDRGAAGERQRLRAAAELAHQRRVRGALDAALGDHDAGGGARPAGPGSARRARRRRSAW